jgi:hypothetical protein
MASAKRKKAAPKSKDAALIKSLRKVNELMMTRLMGIEYLAEYMLEKYVSILTPEEAMDVAVAMVRRAEPKHRLLLTQFIGRSTGFGITTLKRRADQRLQ